MPVPALGRSATAISGFQHLRSRRVQRRPPDAVRRDPGRGEISRRACWRREISFSFRASGLSTGPAAPRVSVNYPEADRFRMLTAVAGNGQAAVGGKTVALDAHQSCIVSPGQSTGLTTEAGHGWFNLRVDPDAPSSRSLTCLLGARPSGKLGVRTRRQSRPPAGTKSLAARPVFFRTAGCRHPLPVTPHRRFASSSRPFWSRSCAPTGTRSAICWTGKPRHTVPSHVRRAEEYIEAHWDRGDHDRAPGRRDRSGGARRSSGRSGKARGYSPMAFARMVRLRRARGEAFRAGSRDLGDRGRLRLRLRQPRTLRQRLSRGVRRASFRDARPGHAHHPCPEARADRGGRLAAHQSPLSIGDTMTSTRYRSILASACVRNQPVSTPTESVDEERSDPASNRCQPIWNG